MSSTCSTSAATRSRGFRLNDRGNLKPIAGSTRALSTTGTGAAQVQFTRDGHALVVTEKATNKIDTFRVNGHGLVTSATVTDSVGQVPYGFDIDRRDHVIVSEAATGSVSSYDLDHGQLSTITGALADTQAAPCWLIASTDGRFAFTTNAASGTISSYRVGRDGSLTLLAAVAGTPGRRTDRHRPQQRWPIHLRPSRATVTSRRSPSSRRFADQPRHGHRCDLDRFVGPRRFVDTDN